MSIERKKKIVFVITKSNWGGAQRYVFDLATGLSRDYFDVVVAFGTNGILKKRLSDAGIRTVTIKSLERNLSITRDIQSFIELLRFFKKERPDIVHLNSSKAGALGAIASRLTKIHKIIFTAHGWPFSEKRSIAWRVFAFIGSFVTALFSDIIITVSARDEHIGKRLPLCKRKIRLIYNGINLSTKLEHGEQIRNAFPPHARITGTIGELTHNKNQIELIEKARFDKNMYVAIVGEGEERKNLERAIQKYQLENRVKLFGFIPFQKVLRGFDVFALPSLKEGLPYVLIEARLAKLPIVANHVGGIDEIINSADIHEFSLENMREKTYALYV